MAEQFHRGSQGGRKCARMWTWIGLLSACCLAPWGAAYAQQGAGREEGVQTPRYRWVIDPRLSLAWWQVDPHLSHLWATTCPQDPSWRPGEGRSLAWAASFLAKARHERTGYAATSDTIVPLYPRGARVFPVCTPAVTGEVTAEDTAAWSGVQGTVAVDAEALVTGLDMRDAYARKMILDTRKYPQIRFRIEGIKNAERADTLRATAVGTLVLRGIERPMEVPIQAFGYEGTVRVTGKFSMPASDLTERYGISGYALGLGVGGRIWKTLHMGVDFILRPVPLEAARQE